MNKPYRDPDMVKLIAELRRRTNLSNRQVALKAKLSSTTVNNIERGKTRHPQHYTLTRIAKAIGLRYQLTEIPSYPYVVGSDETR